MALKQLLMDAIPSLTESDFMKKDTDLHVVAYPEVRDWLQKNYDFWDKIILYTNKDDEWNGKDKLCFDIPYGAWNLNSNIFQVPSVDLLKQGPIENIANSILRYVISNNGGTLTTKTMGQFGVQFGNQIRQRIKGIVTSKKYLCEVHESKINELRAEIEELKNRLQTARKQERRFRKLCINNNIPLNTPLHEPTDETIIL